MAHLPAPVEADLPAAVVEVAAVVVGSWARGREHFPVPTETEFVARSLLKQFPQ